MDVKEIIVQWKGRVVFKMVKKEDWVIVVNKSLKPKKASASFRRLKRSHARSRARGARR